MEAYVISEVAMRVTRECPTNLSLCSHVTREWHDKFCRDSRFTREWPDKFEPVLACHTRVARQILLRLAFHTRLNVKFKLSCTVASCTVERMHVDKTILSINCVVACKAEKG